MKRIYILLFFIIILILLLTVKSNWREAAAGFSHDRLEGVSGAFYSLGQGIAKPFRFIIRIRDMKAEQNSLAKKVLELEVDKSRITELEQENAILKKQIGFLQQNTENQLVPARIIGREPTSFFDYLVIDRGQNDGVVDGLAVISDGILIGQVRETYESSAKVVLITSKDSLIQAMLSECRAKGILRGGISGLYLDNIVSDAGYKNGEYVVTSGLGGKIKQGILIGKAGAERSGSSDIFTSLMVEPIVDLSKLELVFILK